MDITPDEEYIQIARQDIYDNLIWSQDEQLLIKRYRLRNQFLATHEVSFSAALQIKLKNSLFGLFLKYLNQPQRQNKFLNNNKFGITEHELKSLTPEQLHRLAKRNDLTDNLYALLTVAVQKRDVIDYDYLYDCIESLRVADFNINVLDAGARKFRHLQILVLSGNWITDLPGAHLPRKLKFLELFANQISNLQNLARRAPKEILHIGLGRNKLTDYSNLHLLGRSRRFQQLRALDLSNNELYDLNIVVEALESLENLTGLLLEGNPCSVCQSYKDLILKYMPQLLMLDNMEILEGDRVLVENAEDNAYTGALVFTCHRIIGLPQPPKEKGVMQTFHFEVTLPLLEEIRFEPEVEEIEEEKPGKKKAAKPKKEKKPKGGKNKEPSPYDAEDEYADEQRLRVKDPPFKTPRVPWSKVIQLPENALIVESPYQDLTAIRDTFRSCVNVKLVYLKILPPEKKKKGGKDKKDKKDKGKKPKKGQDAGAEKAPPVEEKEPQETIVKKVTLANFLCDLHPVNWSDKTVDYYWAKHSRTTPKSIAVDGDLRAINYIEGKGKKAKDKPAKPKKGKEEQAGEIEVQKIPSRQSLPSIFTCQIGFGLQRLTV